MRNILAIAKKELTVYLTTPMAWVVFTFVSFLTSWFFIGLLMGFKEVHELMRERQVSWNQVPADARIETLRDSLHAALERRLAHPAQLTQLQKVVDETRSLSAASPFPEWSTLAWAERDDVVERKNPYGHSELFVATTLTAAFSGVAAIIAAGIWAGGQEALQLLASAFGLLLSGWVAWSLSESLRERIATHWQSLRLGLSMTSGQRLVALGDVVVFQNNGTSSRVRPKETSIGRSRGTKSGLWRFHLQTGEKIFSRLNSEDADALELLLTKLGFTVELGH